MLNKKAQITLFFLIGILLFASVAFVLRATSVQTKAKLESETEQLTSELLKTTAFENYVNKCLKKLTKEAIIYIGQQGGKIDETQGGITNWLGNPFIPGDKAIPHTKDNQSFYVFYGLKKRVLQDFPRRGEIPTPPEYPYPGKLLEDRTRKERTSYGSKVTIYGAKELLPLCDKKGPNPKRGGIVKKSCKTHGSGDYSIQRQIQGYIEKNLPTCVDFDSFSTNFAYNVSQGNVSINVTFTEEFVSVDAEYPLEIKLKSENKATKILAFRDDVKLRLMRIHEFADNFINNEAKNLLWNNSNYKEVKDGRDLLWDNDLKFYIKKDACTETECSSVFRGETDDIITIVDYSSLIDGSYYEFKFAVENRRPVLELIHEEENFNSSLYDLVVLEGATIQMWPIAFDADEDDLTFNYTGWKAEYDEEYEFLGSEIIRGPIKTNYTDFILENKWHNSEEYIYSQVNASYNTSIGDIGPHNVTLYALDDEGLYDFQTIRILVNDRPIAVAKGDNYYDDIPNEYGSLEDPYEVDATGSRDIFSSVKGITYVFKEDIENINAPRKEPKFKFPTIPSINTITNFGFTQEGFHNFRVAVTDNVDNALGTSIAYVPVTVYPCLPHRNSADPYPYPYNTGADPFQANHTCCLGEISDPSTWRIAQPDDDVQCGPYPFLKCQGTYGNRCV